MIARNFLNGDSLKRIKEKLEESNIPNPAKEAVWNTQTILRILQNEKYAGDVLLQKTYTSDFLEGKVKKNNGELPQYYIQNNPQPLFHEKCFWKFKKNCSEKKQKACNPQKPKRIEGGLPVNMPYPNGWFAGTRMLLPPRYLEHSWTETNCLAVHQPTGTRTKSLRELSNFRGRRSS